ncbi:MAG: hypothetical protein M1132_03275 [Chloroflexi bacterium]|nr:hypothetical protein [Chloroflexota bacterium]
MNQTKTTDKSSGCVLPDLIAGVKDRRVKPDAKTDYLITRGGPRLKLSEDLV